MNLEYEILSFLKEKYTFKMFEIDNWINEKTTYRYKQTSRLCNVSDNIKIKENIDEWEYVDKSVLDMFYDEFLWYNWGKHRLVLKNKKRVIIFTMLEIIQNSLVKTIKYDVQIKSILKEKRIKVHRIKPLPFYERKPVSLKNGDKCYIYRNKTTPAIVDPCLITNVDENEEFKYDVMYFTNYGKFKMTTNNLEINGYNFAKVSAIEIGLTPEDAVRNKY